MTTVRPFGTWPSPISARLIAGEALGLAAPGLAGGDTWWLELRPAEAGRVALVRCGADGVPRDLTEPTLSVRTRVHEYGGGAYTLAPDGSIYASNFADQRLMRVAPDGAVFAVTPAAPLRYADGFIDAMRGRWVGVVERHDTGGEPQNLIGAVDLATGALTPLAEGADFYASPRPSPDGTELAWIQWRHPDMPWDATELWCAGLGDGLQRARRVAGGADESIVQPTWSPDGTLYAASDRGGFWNLHRVEGTELRCVCARDAEFAGPLWGLGAQSYGFRTADTIVCARFEGGVWQLASLAVATGALTPIDTPYSSISSLAVDCHRVVFLGGAPTRPTALVSLDLATGVRRELRRSFDVAIDPGYLSAPRAISFPSTGGATAHALYYPPASRDVTGPADERPPLLVCSHGGPTAAATRAMSLEHQYWTSRGFAVVDVDYRGSTGYGRRYRDALRGRWGEADVDDCCAAARYLADEGLVDPQRLAIRGGSAGGYTTLCALAFRDVFHAGASHFGVSDLASLAADTHKFESRYLDRLIGPFPERSDLYEARSPLRHAAGIRCPVIFLQGLDDAVVPPSQSATMVEALDRAGVPVAYLTFAGEQHGFRRAESIERALGGELAFYAAIFGFESDAPPVEIRNHRR